jgi:cysteine desulfurase/selenocysteine lyase
LKLEVEGILLDYIYFDQAASSFPKPKKVAEAVGQAITSYGANPGRGGHSLAVKAGQTIFETRIKIAKLFGERNANNVIFYQNATYALNQAIQGLQLKKGFHIITTALEHNSVRRPLELLKKKFEIELTYIQPNDTGMISAHAVREAIRDNTVAIVVSHASNVTGAITPIEEIGQIAYENKLAFIVDASQTAGVLPINMEEMNIDCLAFAGHKSLLGPQGTGVLIIKEDFPLEPISYGGTGGFSESIGQPDKRPERFEVGTLNTPGIAGLSAGIDEVNERGLEQIFAHEWKLTQYFLQAIEKMDGVNYYGPHLLSKRLPVVPFTIEGLDSHEAATILDEHYKIALRAGLHCSPLAHEHMETIQYGTLRASFGIYNTIEEIDRLIHAIEEIKAYF